MKLFILLAFAIAKISAASLNNIDESKVAFASGRIINGHVAQPGEAPYIVSLKIAPGHFCAGSIIHRNWVVTAAHCLSYKQFKVVAGLHSRSNETNVQVHEVTNKSQYIIHENFNGGVGPNDIGLIYIPEGFNFDSRVSKVSLPSGKYEPTGRGKLFGWGRDNTGGLSNLLQYLDTDIISYNQCRRALPLFAPIENVNICSYASGKTDGACNGDSGGPLVRYTDDGIEQVGIVSWGYTPCDTTKYPSVYTSVIVYKKWIADKINNFKIADSLQ